MMNYDVRNKYSQIYKIKYLLILLSIVLIHSCQLGRLQDNEVPGSQDDYLSQLKAIPGIEVSEVNFDTAHFDAAFEIFFEQPIDHADPSKGTFTQKFYLNHRDVDAPMVFGINGYSVPNNGFISELAPLLEANYIHVEHRYFADSKPDPMDYDYLTIEQAAKDHHRIIEALKAIYKGKWISTGISKGGQATIFHRSFFPEDVDASIPYVAPVNLAVEDERLITFLDEVGSEECRARILEFQRAVLSNYEEAKEAFRKRAETSGLTFPMGIGKAFELSVMEYEFAYWQWTGGGNCEFIPGEDADTETLINQLFLIDAPGFFTTNSIEYFFPFFYQAYAEIGMYGYSVDSLKPYLREYDSYVNNYHTFIPANMQVVYQPESLQKVHQFLVEDGDEFIFIYGENDAWSATAFVPVEGKTNSITLFQKDGSHFTRINTLSDDQKEIIYDRLEDWLDVDIEE
jgi:hypothetical protein